MLKDELEITIGLAYLSLNDAEKEGFERSVQKMLDCFAMMDRIEVRELEIASQIHTEKNRVRADDPDGFNNTPLARNPVSMKDKIAANFPEASGRLISIPNVL
jgi:aspartyl/glutamyl-tRNA(Asn/Gln) amidotransferase C subunit